MLLLVSTLALSIPQCAKQRPPQQTPVLPPLTKSPSIPEGESDDWSWADYAANETLEYPDNVGRGPANEEVYYSELESEDFLRGNYSNGVNLTSMGSQTAFHAVTLDPDGKLLIIGRTHNGTHNNYALTRTWPDGSLDTGFSTVGQISVDFGQNRGEVAHAFSTDGQGKIVAVGRYNFGTAPGNYFIWSIARFNANGTLDTALASTGQVLINLNSLNAVARSVRIQQDGKMVIAGYAATQLDSVGPQGAQPPYYQKQYDAVLVRLNSNGSLDTSLGSNGIIFASLSNASTKMDGYYAVGLANDGKIIAGGFRDDGTAAYEAIAARYTSAGALDAAFNGAGIVAINSSSAGRDTINALALQSDNKVVVTGFSYNGSNFDFYTGRINSNGTMDTSFNRAGGHLLDAATSRDDFAFGLGFQEDGKILVVGKSFGSANYDIALARYLTNGALDTTNFGTNGRILSTAGSGDDLAYGVAASSGMIYVVGTTGVGVNNQAITIRYNTDGVIATSGRLDRSFGTNGVITASIGTAADDGFGMVTQTDGKFLVVGTATVGGKVHFGLARFRPDGFLDTSFGTTTGTTFTSFSVDTEQANAVALHTNGSFVVAGNTGTGGNGNSIAIARYRSDGILDSTFSGDGRIILSLTTREDAGNAVAIQTDSRPVVVGTAEPANNQLVYAIVRLTTTGILDTSFSSTGLTITNWSTREDKAYGVAIQTDGKIIATGTAEVTANNNYDFGTVRYLTNGNLDTTFGTTAAGRSVLNLGGANEEAYSLVIQANGKVLVAGTTDASGNFDFAVARYTSTGILDTSFATNGYAIVAINGNEDRARSVLVQPNGKVVLVGYANNGVNFDFAVARLNDNGTLDTSLGSNGTMLLSIGSGIDQAYGAALTTDGRIVAAGTVVRTNNDLGIVRIWP